MLGLEFSEHHSSYICVHYWKSVVRPAAKKLMYRSAFDSYLVGVCWQKHEVPGIEGDYGVLASH